MKNEFKINIQVIYCFPNYTYFSFNKLNIDLKEMKKNATRTKRTKSKRNSCS